MKTTPAHRIIRTSVVWGLVCGGVGGLALVQPALAGRPIGEGGWAVATVAAVAAVMMLARAWLVAGALGGGLAQVRTAVLNLVAGRRELLPPEAVSALPAEVAELHGALALYQGQALQGRQAPDRRLVAVLGAMASGVVVVTADGQVSLLNYPARELLGAERTRVGTSVFAALERGSVLRAVDRARRFERPIEAVFERLDGVELQGRVAPLADHEGSVLIFPSVELARHRPHVDFDLGLHDAPTPPAGLSGALPLDDLPLLVLDTETTGLDATQDRVISLGAVCAHGTRIFRNHIVDQLVDPGLPIPPASTAVHGLTDEMVAGAGGFAEAHAHLERLACGRVLVGHNVPFDLTILHRECTRHGRTWAPRPFIDTMRLASLLNPTLRRYALEDVAALYQVDLLGRHTALGDALVTAELFRRMIPRLQQQGIDTFGRLLRFHDDEAVDVIAGQREAGWIVTQPDGLALDD